VATPYMGEIRVFPFEFAPKGWALCNGQLLPINQNQALFALLGTRYGGNGITTFALPDFRGRTPIHWGNGHVPGERDGEDTHTLSIMEMGAHTHPVLGTRAKGVSADPSDRLWAAQSANAYGTEPDSAMAPGLVTNVGGSQPHENMQPYLTLSFCIALQGYFPSMGGTEMSAEAFTGEVRMFGFDIAPTGWAYCDGQVLPLSTNVQLFSLLGTTYGGNGSSSFALPDLQGRAPMHPNPAPEVTGLSLRALGESGGSETVSLLSSEVPTHAHRIRASVAPADETSPVGTAWGGTASSDPTTYGPATTTVLMASDALAVAGASSPHNNMQPYLTVNFCIATKGQYPPRDY